MTGSDDLCVADGAGLVPDGVPEPVMAGRIVAEVPVTDRLLVPINPFASVKLTSYTPGRVTGTSTEKIPDHRC